MSMRNYGIADKGLIITPYNAIEFLNCYQGNNEIDDEYNQMILDSIKDERISDFELFEYLMQDILCFDLLGDFSGQYNKLFGNISQKGNVLRNDEDFFEDENVFIFYLEKDLLFDKYENLEEIYNEVRNHFKEYGFILSDEFLKKNVGELEGVIFG